MLVRCDDHPSQQYQHRVDPVGYPDTAAICGRCDNPGRILLSEKEWVAYQTGRRIFDFNSNIMQVQAG